jgi:UPF0755 protein
VTEQEDKTEKNSLSKRIVLWAILLLFLLAAASAVWMAQYLLSSGTVQPGREITVTIPKGSSVRTIGGILGEAGLINYDFRFLLLARFSGYSGRLQAGEFRLKGGNRPGDVIRELAFARPVQHPVTVVEGLRAREIAELFSGRGWCDGAKFLLLTEDKQFIESLGFAGLPSLEGYLYPDTYLLTADMKGAEKIITMQVHRFLAVWHELAAGAGHEINREKTVILASMVEKEAAVADERALIAGVFANRLSLGMRLQSDPTVVYPIENFSGKITRKQLRDPTPYNTYTLPGLPAGPICNPGKESLKAALHPAETKFLYFVARNDGTHQFSESLARHNRAVRKYQRKKRKKNVK